MSSVNLIIVHLLVRNFIGFLELIISRTVSQRSSTILDLLITNYFDDFLNTGTLSSPSTSCDHSIIYAGKMNIHFINFSVLKGMCGILEC